MKARISSLLPEKRTKAPIGLRRMGGGFGLELQSDTVVFESGMGVSCLCWTLEFLGIVRNRVRYSRSSGSASRIDCCIASNFLCTVIVLTTFTPVEARSAGVPAGGRPLDFDTKSASEVSRSGKERGAAAPSGSRDGAPVGFVP